MSAGSDTVGLLPEYQWGTLGEPWQRAQSEVRSPIMRALYHADPVAVQVVDDAAMPATITLRHLSSLLDLLEHVGHGEHVSAVVVDASPHMVIPWVAFLPPQRRLDQGLALGADRAVHLLAGLL